MSATESIVVDGYDLLAETARVNFRDHVVCGRRLNRGTAAVSADGTPHAAYEDVKAEHARLVFPNTLSANCPVVDLSYPAAGMFVDSPAGVYLDLYQGVAQKLIDEHHPVFDATIAALVASGLAFRREINTDDYLVMSERPEHLHTSQDLAELITGLTQKAFPRGGPFRVFFSNSGAEAGEAAIKLAQLHAYRRFLRKHGPDVFARVMADLGIPRVTHFDADVSALKDPLFADYPFFLIGCDGAFHGRTLGVLNLTWSKKAHHVAFSKMRWVRHIPFNGRAEDFTSLLDDRPITELLDAPGGIAGVLASGRVPSDLVALFAVECYQGEGGYHFAEGAWLKAIARACAARNILFGADEVQSFGRTGALYAAEHFAIQPDVVWASKGAVVGFTVARAEYADDMHVGWHSNTFGGGKFFDVNMAWATIDTLTHGREPLFEGRTCLQNSRLKGEYVRLRLADLAARHAAVFRDFSGLAGMWGLTVRHREEIIETGWRLGAKLLGCGNKGELSRLRIVLLTDVLTREIDQMIEVLDRVLGTVAARHDDDE